MPRNLYASGFDPKDVVEVSWPGKRYDGWELTVSLGGRKLGVIPNADALAVGRTFTLSGNHGVRIQLVKGKGLVATAGGLELPCVENAFSLTGKRLITAEDSAAVQAMIADYKAMHPETRERGRKASDRVSAHHLVLLSGCFLIALAILSVTELRLYRLLDPFYALYGPVNFPFTLGGGVLFVVLGLLARRDRLWPLPVSIILYGFYGSYFVVLSMVTLDVDFSNGLIAELTLFLLFSVVFLLTCAEKIRFFYAKERDKQ